jgi:hypothetical protein
MRSAGGDGDFLFWDIFLVEVDDNRLSELCLSRWSSPERCVETSLPFVDAMCLELGCLMTMSFSTCIISCYLIN